jgi:hypothetical protein
MSPSLGIHTKRKKGLFRCANIIFYLSVVIITKSGIINVRMLKINIYRYSHLVVSIVGSAVQNTQRRYWKAHYSKPLLRAECQRMTRYSLYRRLAGPQRRSGRIRKISSTPGFDLRTVEPLASRYTDEPILA